MKTNNRAANMRAIQKMRTTAATQLNDQEELSHFDRLPPHLQVHIKGMAAEAFAREHMRLVHQELLARMAFRKLKEYEVIYQPVHRLQGRVEALEAVLRKVRIPPLRAALQALRREILEKHSALTDEPSCCTVPTLACSRINMRDPGPC